jgi:hypothetical protein
MFQKVVRRSKSQHHFSSPTVSSFWLSRSILTGFVRLSGAKKNAWELRLNSSIPATEYTEKALYEFTAP